MANRASSALSLLFPLALLVAAAPAARAQGAPHEMSVEEAHGKLPRADLSGLTGEQRYLLWEVAGDTFSYASCNSTLAACLRADQKGKHAPRMARLAAQLIKDGLSQSQTIFQLEQYYASFDAKRRQRQLRTDDAGCQGDAKAPLTLVEYSDYQCPHCATVVKPLHDLYAQLKGKARFCSKYFPLPGHPRAAIAAAVAEAARARGKFWQMNELLFAHQDELEDANLKAWAKQVGLDGEQILKEAYSGKHTELVERHKAEGLAAGVRATPTVFFNGRALTLPVKLEYLVHSAEDELEWQKNGGAWDKD